MIRGRTIPERSGRWLVGGLNLFALGLMLLPLVLVSWLSVISNEILSLPVEGCSLHWPFGAALSFIRLSVTVSITVLAGYYIKRRY